MITVGNEDRVSGGAKQDLAILSGNAAQLADGGILLKDDLPLVADEDLQRVALPNAHGSADLLGNNDPSQIVDTPYNASSFHIYYNSLSCNLLCG